MFETARRHMPEDDIVICFVINNLGFWYSRYTVPVSWGLDTACLQLHLTLRLCHSRNYWTISIDSCIVCIDEDLSGVADTVYWLQWNDTLTRLHGSQT
jgi:hypothetical protein